MAIRKTGRENRAQNGIAELADELASRIVSLKSGPAADAPTNADATHAARIALLEKSVTDAWQQISELQRQVSILRAETGVETS